MYPGNYQDNKAEKKRRIRTLIAILLLISALICLLIFILENREKLFAQENELEVKEISERQDISFVEEESENDYTEIVGYGCLDVSSKRPSINLENVTSNDVYLQFDVYEDNSLLYSSKLIQPGDYDSLNVYSLLPEGQHLLTYRITTYDINTKKQLMSGISQTQEINIIGG